MRLSGHACVSIRNFSLAVEVHVHTEAIDPRKGRRVMKIGIIGAGNIGGNLTRRLTALGHEVSVANSRGPHTLTALAEETGATAVTVEEARAGRRARRRHDPHEGGTRAALRPPRRGGGRGRRHRHRQLLPAAAGRKDRRDRGRGPYGEPLDGPADRPHGREGLQRHLRPGHPRPSPPGRRPGPHRPSGGRRRRVRQAVRPRPHRRTRLRHGRRGQPRRLLAPAARHARCTACRRAWRP